MTREESKEPPNLAPLSEDNKQWMLEVLCGLICPGLMEERKQREDNG